MKLEQHGSQRLSKVNCGSVFHKSQLCVETKQELWPDLEALIGTLQLNLAKFSQLDLSIKAIKVN